jgi:hypothetical protein
MNISKCRVCFFTCLTFLIHQETIERRASAALDAMERKYAAVLSELEKLKSESEAVEEMKEELERKEWEIKREMDSRAEEMKQKEIMVRTVIWALLT